MVGSAAIHSQDYSSRVTRRIFDSVERTDLSNSDLVLLVKVGLDFKSCLRPCRYHLSVIIAYSTFAAGLSLLA